MLSRATSLKAATVNRRSHRGESRTTSSSRCNNVEFGVGQFHQLRFHRRGLCHRQSNMTCDTAVHVALGGLSTRAAKSLAYVLFALKSGELGWRTRHRRRESAWRHAFASSTRRIVPLRGTEPSGTPKSAVNVANQ